jgi:hypothetical protein
MTSAVAEGRPTTELVTAGAVATRPVLLLTFDVPYDAAAVAFAFETAAETSAELLIADIVPAMRVPATSSIRTFGDPYVVSTQVELVRQAAAQGLKVKRIVFSHPRPIGATLDLLRDQGIGMLVFGPDRKRYGRWRFRRHAARFRRDAPCLVWPYD